MVHWSYDGQFLAVDDISDYIRIYDTTTWELIDKLKGHSYGPTSFDWSCNDLCASGSFDNQIKIWRFNETPNTFILEKELELTFDQTE